MNKLAKYILVKQYPVDNAIFNASSIHHSRLMRFRLLRNCTIILYHPLFSLRSIDSLFNCIYNSLVASKWYIFVEYFVPQCDRMI